MPKIELIFFKDCPNVEPARKALTSIGIFEFLEVNQTNLEECHPYKNYSSPSILIDGNVVVGSKNNSSACSIIDWKIVSKVILKQLLKEKEFCS